MPMRNIARFLLACVLLPPGCDFIDLNLPPDRDGVLAGLWTVSGEPSRVLHLERQQLQGNGDLSPVTTIGTTSALLGTLTGVAFAQDGTLWLASPEDSLVIAFSPMALTTSGTRTAARVIEPVGGSLRAPASLAFDVQRRLWVVNHEAGTVVRYDPDQLAVGGALEPAAMISGLGHPTGIAFDVDGALWVTDNLASTITRIDPAQLAGGQGTIHAVVVNSSSCFVNPSGLAFDTFGYLWVANVGCDNVVAFSPDQLRQASSVSPRIVLSGNPSFASPVGLAFDEDDNLWVLGVMGRLTEIARSNLLSSGSPPALTTAQLSGYNLLWNIAFWPIPAGLPLR